MITFARKIVVLFLMAFLLLGCASTQRHELRKEVSGTEAIHMIEAGDVHTVFEPHNGPSTIQLRDGRRIYVDSGYDLILNMEKHGLMDRVENVYME